MWGCEGLEILLMSSLARLLSDLCRCLPIFDLKIEAGFWTVPQGVSGSLESLEYGRMLDL